MRQTKGDDYYLTLTESTKRFNGDGHERHKIFLYKEDFNRFLSNLEEVINYVKTELMPDFDYEEFDNYNDNSGSEPRAYERDREPRPPRQPRPPREQRYFREDNQNDDEIEEDPTQWRKPSPPPPPPSRDTKFDDDLSW